MVKRFFFLVITAAFISSFLLLAGTAILDRVNAARTESRLQALRVAGTSLSDSSQPEDSQTSNQDPIGVATEPALSEGAAYTIGEVLANPQSFSEDFLTLTGTATVAEGNLVTISDGTGELQVAIENTTVPLSGGEKLTVTGMLNVTGGGANLDACRVLNSQGMVIQVHGCDQSSLVALSQSAVAAAGPTSTIAELINDPAGFYNQMLTITGMITLLDDDEFLINDGTGQIIVDVDDDHSEHLPFTNGQIVTVSGYFENDGQYLDIDACEISGEDGTAAVSIDCTDHDDDFDDNSNDQVASEDRANDDDGRNDNSSTVDDQDDDHSSSSDDNENDENRSGSDDDDDRDHDDDNDNDHDDDHDDDDNDNDHDDDNDNDHDDDHDDDDD